MPDQPSDTRVAFRYLSEPDMIAAGVTDMPGCIDTMEEVFDLLGQGDYRLAGTANNSHGAWLMFPASSPFPTMPLDGPDRRFMAMPAYLGGRYGLTGVKWYGSNAANKQRGLPRSILMFVLNDTDTGAPMAFMSANLLSATRTGAVPGVGARYFARPDSEVLAIIGPGVMNKTSIAAFTAECPSLRAVKILGRSQRGIDSFSVLVREKYPSIESIEVVGDIETAVRDADIVSVAASAPANLGSAGYPLLKREWLKPGAYVSMPADARVDDALCRPDVLKVLDSRGQYEAWAEEYPFPHHEHVGILGTYFMDLIESGKMDPHEPVDLGDIVCGKTAGRQDADQIVLFSIGGLPVEDVAWASKVYDNAVRDGIGTELTLWDAPALV